MLSKSLWFTLSWTERVHTFIGRWRFPLGCRAFELPFIWGDWEGKCGVRDAIPTLLPMSVRDSGGVTWELTPSCWGGERIVVISGSARLMASSRKLEECAERWCQHDHHQVPLATYSFSSWRPFSLAAATLRSLWYPSCALAQATREWEKIKTIGRCTYCCYPIVSLPQCLKSVTDMSKGTGRIYFTLTFPCIAWAYGEESDLQSHSRCSWKLTGWRTFSLIPALSSRSRSDARARVELERDTEVPGLSMNFLRNDLEVAFR